MACICAQWECVVHRFLCVWGHHVTGVRDEVPVEGPWHVTEMLWSGRQWRQSPPARALTGRLMYDPLSPEKRHRSVPLLGRHRMSHSSCHCPHSGAWILSVWPHLGESAWKWGLDWVPAFSRCPLFTAWGPCECYCLLPEQFRDSPLRERLGDWPRVGTPRLCGHQWELDLKESRALKNWCFWTAVLEKSL